MRFFCLFLLSLLSTLHMNAQKAFSQKDFNKLKQLADLKNIMYAKQDGILELWKIENDTLLTGTLYKDADNVRLPLADMQLYYTRGQIKMDHTYLDANGAKGSVHSLVLQNIDSSIYYFRNTADITTRNIKEMHCSAIAYNLSWKKMIRAERKLILPGKGFVTVKYTFIADK